MSVRVLVAADATPAVRAEVDHHARRLAQGHRRTGPRPLVIGADPENNLDPGQVDAIGAALRRRAIVRVIDEGGVIPAAAIVYVLAEAADRRSWECEP